MARKVIDVTGDIYVDGYLADGEFLVGIDFTPDYGVGGLANVASAIFLISQSPLSVPAVSADWLYIFTDSDATTLCTIAYSTAVGFMPFPIVGKLCGPARVTMALDTAVTTATQVAFITSKE